MRSPVDCSRTLNTVMSSFVFALGIIGIPANAILIVAIIAVNDANLKLELHLMLHSFLLIAISFWYRSTVLANNCPSRVNIQLRIGLILIPTLFSTSLFNWTTDSWQILPMSYPELNLTKIAHSGSRLDDFRMIFIVAYCAFTPILAYGFIFYFKEQVNKKMGEHSENMSCATRSMHQSLIKALTYHSLLPSLFILGILLFFVQTMGVQNAAMERAVFLFYTIPPAINPMFTLYFVRSYRRFITMLLRRRKLKSGTKIVPSNEA
ncbi:hypothetical protein PRIPAC_82880 [Pristionchus pacificus]|uniref:G protein-coupled receptor n=1 Tax=Pristionchus pacificus TaxID=54126 RepID=A0A2A6CMX2_PRIPA|nr:hypothetical protein PRIPAC_82880 [Pristionchus pacificus]|eukprot:PDM79446.1 G protein-coupled receptor [Pristionchus pacificus]